MAETEPGYGTADFAGALGHTIKVLRTDRGIERKDLADQAGISYSHLASIEAGQKQPSPQVLTAIAAALGMASHELLESVEYRRRRNLRPNSDPWWLTGEPAAVAPAPMTVARAVRQGLRPEAVSPDAADLAAFVAEITDLAAQMGPKERLLLLDTARQFAGRYR